MTVQSVLPPLLGGALIGLAAVVLLALNGRVMGASGIWSGLITWSHGSRWRLAFAAGCVAAPLLMAAAGRPGVVELQNSLPGLALAGVLVGFGTGLGSGCTSGHGVCGISRLSPRSIAATGVFMAAGMITVAVVRHLL